MIKVYRWVLFIAGLPLGIACSIGDFITLSWRKFKKNV